MKTITDALKTHLGLDSMTLATLWDLSRPDGDIIYFTDHDEDIIYGGNTYVAATGFTPSATEHKDDMSPDNLEVTTFLDVDAVDEADVRAHKYDGASIKIRLVNWADTSMGDLKILAGTTGDVTMENGLAKVQLRSINQRLTTQLGQVYGPNCRADLFDSKCKLDKSTYQQSGTVAAVTDASTWTSTTALKKIGIAPLVAAPTAWFNDGIITFTSGNNSSNSFEIKTSVLATGTYTFVMQEAFPFPLQPGDTFTIEPGCDKTRGAGGCGKFSNIVNFRGEPDIPGPNAVLNYPDAPQ
jgi:uncharacterized phage protein (TIGR02218 family)